MKSLRQGPRLRGREMFSGFLARRVDGIHLGISKNANFSKSSNPSSSKSGEVQAITLSCNGTLAALSLLAPLPRRLLVTAVRILLLRITVL